MSRQRLDNELVRRGLVENRSQAQEAIKAGRVTVDGAPADKPSRMVALSQTLFVAGDPPRYVSRGGLKLEAALEFFNIDVIFYDFFNSRIESHWDSITKSTFFFN